MGSNIGEEKNKPKVSVVMPHYNQSHLVSNAINSIRNQTLEDWELIIVDDGSNSDHQIKLRKIVIDFTDSRISIVQNPHLGLVAARNEGCRFAKADIIAHQDADDLSMPDRLKKCFDLISSGWDIIYHGLYINMWDLQFNCIGRQYVSAHYKPSKDKILQGQYIPGVAVFKKKVWEKKPFRMDTQYAFDWMMWIDWIYSNFKIYNLDQGLYEYVRHENSASIIFERDGRRKQSIEKIKEIVKKEYGQSII